MTFVDDLMDEKDQGSQSPYPSAFGVEFTPTVGGGLLGFLGLAGAAAVGYLLIFPAWTALQELKSSVDTKRTEKAALEQAQARITELTAQLQVARSNQREVLSLFAGEDATETLLYALSQQVGKSRGQLLEFSPPETPPTPVTDGSWGPDVNNLLKSQNVTISFEAGFGETMTILRDIERLQALVAVEKMSSEVTNQEKRRLVSGGNVTTTGEAVLTTRMDLELLYPVSEEELATLLAPPPADPNAPPADPNAAPPPADPNAAPPPPADPNAAPPPAP